MAKAKCIYENDQNNRLIWQSFSSYKPQKTRIQHDQQGFACLTLVSFKRATQRANFIKKRHQRRCFPVKFAKFLRTPILKNICERHLFRSYTYTYH